MNVSAPFPDNVIVNLSPAVGQALLGTFLATAFWGMTCIQTVFYFVTYESDRWHLKALVVILWLLDTAHEILCITALWRTLIPRFGDFEKTTRLDTNFMWQVVLASFVAFIARGFFTWRIFLFAKKKWIFPVLLIPPSIGDTTGTFIWAFKAAGKPSSYLGTPAVSRLFLACSLIVTATDILIATIMCILLWGNRTGHVATDRLILRLMNASVTTGSWTAVMGIFCVITTLAWPEALYSLVGQLPLCTLYCNAVLGNLNSRRYIGDVKTTTLVGSKPMAVRIPHGSL